MPRKFIDLLLDYEEIRKRITLDMTSFKKYEWADKVKVSKSLITGIHKEEGKKGKRTNPSLEYIIAVSNFTGKPVEWYLYGRWPALTSVDSHHTAKEEKSDKNDTPDFLCGCDDEIIDACKDVKEILESGNETIAPALVANIKAFKHGVRQDKRLNEIENKINYIEKMNSKTQGGVS